MEILLRLWRRQGDERSAVASRAVAHGIVPRRTAHPERTTSIAALMGAFVVIAFIGVAAAAASDTIKIEGNRRIDTDAIRQHFLSGRRSGGSERVFSPAALDAALKELYATGQFEDVKIVRTETGLIVRVVEAPVLDRLQFEGNKQFKDAGPHQGNQSAAALAR